MTFFNPTQPILCEKNLDFNTTDLQKMKCIKVKFLEKTPFSSIYTCIDQSFIAWGFIAGFIFISAQFLAVSWLTQAIFWSILTIIGIIAMIILTHAWVKQEKLQWLLYLWSFLMLFGLLITDLGVVFGWAFVLINLCHIWLILSAIGYFLTGLGMHSRALFIAAIIHFMPIFCLPFFTGWQFLITGLIMMSNLLIFSDKQWDRVLPRDINYSKKYDSNSHFNLMITSPSYVLINPIFTNKK